MSGGSWDYVYRRIEDAADLLRTAKCPHRRALGTLMEKVARAMHDIEWVDSCDMSHPDEIPAIREALGHGADALALREAVEEARKVQAELAMLITDAEATLGG